MLIEEGGRVQGVFVDGEEWFGLETRKSVLLANDWFFGRTFNIPGIPGVKVGSPKSMPSTSIPSTKPDHSPANSLYGDGDTLEEGEISTPVQRSCAITFKVSFKAKSSCTVVGALLHKHTLSSRFCKLIVLSYTYKSTHLFSNNFSSTFHRCDIRFLGNVYRRGDICKNFRRWTTGKLDCRC